MASLIVIFFTVFIDLIGFGIIIPILQPYGRMYGASDLEAGLLMGIFPAVQFFVIPVWGWLSQRYGRKPIILVGLFGTVISYVILAMAGSLAMLFAGRIFAGISAGNLVAAQAYIADITPPEKRAHGMSLIGIAFGLGFILGPTIGGILSHHSFALPSIVAAVFSAVAFLFGLFVLVESLPPEKRQAHGPMRHPILDISEVASDPAVMRVILANFLFTVAFSAWETVFVLFVGEEVMPGVEEKVLSGRVGYLFAFAGLLSALVQGGGIRHLVKRHGEKPLAQAGFVLLILGCLGFVAISWSDSNVGVGALLPVLALIGVGSGLVNPTASAMVSRLVGPDKQGQVFGAFRGMGSLGRVIGPVSAAFLFASVAHSAPYLFGVALLIGAILLLVGDMRYHGE